MLLKLTLEMLLFLLDDGVSVLAVGALAVVAVIVAVVVAAVVALPPDVVAAVVLV